jgi:hypothetical protein
MSFQPFLTYAVWVRWLPLRTYFDPSDWTAKLLFSSDARPVLGHQQGGNHNQAGSR